MLAGHSCQDAVNGGRRAYNEGLEMGLGIKLIGDGLAVPCLDGKERPYINLDAAASTGAHPAVAKVVEESLSWYSSVHRGTGYKSQLTTAAYELARETVLEFANKSGNGDIAVMCRNTTEAINHLAYRMRFGPDDVVVTTVVEHHANLLPWGRVASRRFVECQLDGTFSVDDVCRALDTEPRPRLLAITGASNVTGWRPPLEEIIAEAHERDLPVMVDAAQLAPHRPLPRDADFVVFSGHKMYAPYGAGALIGPRSFFSEGDPFLAGGGAVELVDLDEVVWSDPPEREEAGSPNVLGALALATAASELMTIGFEAITAHDEALSTQLRSGLAGIKNVRLLGPSKDLATLPVASFVIKDVPHALVAARLSAEFAIGVRNGCFCAHPYLVRLLGLSSAEIDRFRTDARNHDRSRLPGAVRASASLSTTPEEIDALLEAVSAIAHGGEDHAPYRMDPMTGERWPVDFARPDESVSPSTLCSPG